MFTKKQTERASLLRVVTRPPLSAKKTLLCGRFYPRRCRYILQTPKASNTLFFSEVFIMRDINSLILYYDWYKLLLNFSNDEKGILLDLIFKHSIGENIDFQIPDTVKVVFDFIKIYLDRDKSKYIEKCKKNEENIKKRYEKRQEKKKNTSYDLDEAKKLYDD
ncbi:MAG: hypothetical protein IKF53_02415 [Clostridia bacterium]|nr:hypothetical protein [Clostridia bacterium]